MIGKEEEKRIGEMKKWITGQIMKECEAWKWKNGRLLIDLPARPVDWEPAVAGKRKPPTSQGADRGLWLSGGAGDDF